MGESKSADVVDKLVRAVGGKFNGLKFNIWRRTAQSVISMRHPEVAYIIDGQQCPKQMKVQSRGRIPSRTTPATTRSRGQQPGTEDVTPAEAHDEDQEGKQTGEHQESTPPSSATYSYSKVFTSSSSITTLVFRL